MPVVHVEMFEGRTIEQKRELVDKITGVFVDVTKCSPDAVTIVIEEMSKSNFAQAGKLYSDL